jgi:hypothetical protein
MSSVHKSSASEATGPPTTISNQTPATLATAPALSEQQEMAYTVLKCDVCIYYSSNNNKEALEWHKRFSPHHGPPVSKTAISSQASNKNSRTNNTHLAQTHFLRTVPDVKETVGTLQQKPFCSSCNRHFQTLGGFRSHVTTSKEHKAKLGQLESRGDSKKSPYGRRIAPTMGFADRTVFAAWLKTVPVQILGPIDPPTNQDSSSISPLLAGEEQGEALLAASAAYPFCNRWSNVAVHGQQSILEALREKCHSIEQLSINGYFVRPLTSEEVEGTRKCNDCGGMDGPPCLSWPQG